MEKKGLIETIGALSTVLAGQVDLSDVENLLGDFSFGDEIVGDGDADLLVAGGRENLKIIRFYGR